MENINSEVLIVIKRLYLIIGLACLTLLLQGCPPPYYRIIYNNTGTDLLVQYKNQMVEWQVGKAIRIISGYTLRIPDETIPIYWDELDSGGDQNTVSYAIFRVLHGERILKYKFKHFDHALPSGYIDSSKGSPTTVWQLESDFSLYITLPKSVYPEKMPIRQPTGYPLKAVSALPGNKS